MDSWAGSGELALNIVQVLGFGVGVLRYWVVGGSELCLEGFRLGVERVGFVGCWSEIIRRG